MKFKTDKFGKDDVQRNETLFTIGNGNLGFRGDTEEKQGTYHKGTYINGFFDKEKILYGENAYGYAENHETILNLPDPKRIELWVNGCMFATDGTSGLCSKNTLELDEASGLLTRNCSWTSDTGDSIKLKTERLVSFKNQDCAVIRYTVKVVSDFPVEIILASCVDTTAGNILAENDPRVGAKFRHKPLEIISTGVDFNHKEKNAVISFKAKTAKSELYLAGNILNFLKIDGNAVNFDRNIDVSLEDKDIPYAAVKLKMSHGQTLKLEKYITYAWNKPAGTNDVEQLSKIAAEENTEFAASGFDAACISQKKFLDDFWNIADIKIDGDAESEKALHFNLFHLLQSAGRNGLVSIAAKGLTSEGYEGHFFWDTESYVCPVFTYTAPEIAKKLLEYRASILPKAQERAEELNLKGALYPWRTIDGEECSAYYPAGTAQYHINADIIFALNRFLNAHGDKAEFDKTTVESMCAETARMWQSLGHFNLRKGGKFCIEDVTGPDEYTAIVNNNAYTNLMARENLEISVLRSGTAASEKEKSEWRNIARNMYVPFDKEEGIYPQDDGFMDKADWDFKNTPESKYPLLLHFHPLEIYRHRVLKQPDLVLAQFLLSDRFTRAEKIRNFDFYKKYTTGDSSLACSIMSIMACETGDVEKAFEYFKKTAGMDIEDVNGNSRDGIHTACMAGSWMSIVYGFAGFRDYGGIYKFNPELPAAWSALSFRMKIKGCVLGVMISHDFVQYRLESGTSLKITHRNMEVELKHGQVTEYSLKPELKAVLFDLDGVITDTSRFHYLAWKSIADVNELRFDEEMNRKLLGISREGSLEVILRENQIQWPPEKRSEVCDEKNRFYRKYLRQLGPQDILPGITELLIELKKNNIPAVLASSSRNAPTVIKALGIKNLFSEIADVNDVQMAKPEPDIFLKASEQAGVWYADCVAIEDAEAGIAAIKKAGMKAIGISRDGNLKNADLQLKSTAELTLDVLKKLFK